MKTMEIQQDNQLESFRRMLAGYSRMMRSFFCSSLLWENGYFFVRLASQLGIFDEEGNEVIAPRYDEILDHEHEEVCRVRRGESWGLYRKRVGEIRPCVYNELKPISGGLLEFSVTGEWKYTQDYWDPWNDYFGIMERNSGKILVPADFDRIEYLFDGLAKVKQYDKWGYYNVEVQRLTIPCKYAYDDLGDIEDGTVWVITEGKRIYLDRNGNTVENPNPEEQEESTENTEL